MRMFKPCRRWALGLGATTAVAGLLVNSASAQQISTTVQVDADRSFLPIQSYTEGETETSIVFFGGLTDMGLHAFASNAFPASAFNTQIIVVDKTSGELWASDTGSLPDTIREVLTVTAPASVQFGNTLYMYGGYGPAIIEPDLTTRDRVTEIDLVAVENAVRNGQEIPASAFSISQSQAAQVAGAGIVKFSDGRRFALICGANAIGDYANQGDPIYSNVIHIFDRTVSMTKPVQTMDDGLGFSSPMHRRDVNTLPATMPGPKGTTLDGFVVLAGAFENGIFLFETPLQWADGDPLPSEDELFTQHIGAYEGPSASLYSALHDTNHYLMMSGISAYEPDGQGGFIWNPSAPWTAVASQITMVNGVFSDETISGDMPWPTTNAKLILEEELPQNELGQVMLDELTPGVPILLGRIYGGIAATQTGTTSPTFASDAVLNVFITVERDPGVFATITKVAFDFGSLVDGDVTDLVSSDDEVLRTRSQFGFSAAEANIMRARFRFNTDVVDPVALDLISEARLNNPGGNAEMALRNFNSATFDTIRTYPIGLDEQVTHEFNVDATNYVRSDGLITLRIKHAVIATFSAAGFDSFFDQVAVEVR